MQYPGKAGCLHQSGHTSGILSFQREVHLFLFGSRTWKNEKQENLSGTDSENYTSHPEEFLSDSESKSDYERIDVWVFGKDPVDVQVSLMNYTLQQP